MSDFVQWTGFNGQKHPQSIELAQPQLSTPINMEYLPYSILMVASILITMPLNHIYTIYIIYIRITTAKTV